MLATLGNNQGCLLEKLSFKLLIPLGEYRATNQNFQCDENELLNASSKLRQEDQILLVVASDAHNSNEARRNYSLVLFWEKIDQSPEFYLECQSLVSFRVLHKTLASVVL